MKNFLTKNEACQVLNQVGFFAGLPREDSVALASIRVCLAAENMGYNFWGTPVEEARPLFRDCEIPDANSSSDVVSNYEAYKFCIANLKEKLALKKEAE